MATCLWAQNPLVPIDIREAYEDREYDEVVDLARRFLRDHPDSPARHEVSYLAGEASWELRRYSQAEELLAPVVEEAQASVRWPRAALLLSRALERRREYFGAAELLSLLLSRNPGEDVRDDADDMLEDLVEDSLSLKELSYLAYKYDRSPLHCKVLERAADILRDERRWEELWDLSGIAVPKCLQRRGREWERFMAAAAPHAPSARCRDPYLIGLAFPTDGPYREFGESLVRGATLALDEHNAGARFDLAFAVGNTGGDPISAVSCARGLLLDRGAACVIGGLLSSTTVAIAGVSSAVGAPLVSPSATRENVADAGPLVYQSTLPRILQARALAQAARSRIGASSAAILYPETADGELLSGSFRETFVLSGGTIVFSSGYLEGETNFSAALSAAASKSPDCLLLAGGARDLAPLIPQLAYYDLEVPVLATESIALGRVADLARKHLEAVLYSPGAYSLAGEARERFEGAFKAKYGIVPDDFAVKGYLAARLVTAAIGADSRTRTAVARRLAEFVFDEERLKANRFLAVTELQGVEVPVLELGAEE